MTATSSLSLRILSSTSWPEMYPGGNETRSVPLVEITVPFDIRNFGRMGRSYCLTKFANASKFAKNTPLGVVFSTHFSVFGYHDETLSLVFDILLTRRYKHICSGIVSQYQTLLYRYWTQQKQIEESGYLPQELRLDIDSFKLPHWICSVSNCLLFALPSNLCSQRIMIFFTADVKP